MKALTRALLALTLAAALVQCQDREAPTSVDLSRGLQTAQVTAADIQMMIDALTEGGIQNAAMMRFRNINRQYNRGQVHPAQQMTFALIDFLVRHCMQGKCTNPNGGDPPTTEEALADLIEALLEFVGIPGGPIPPGAFEEDGAFERCGPEGCVVVTGTEFAGVAIPPGALDGDAFISIARLPDESDPLETDLDQYPLFYEFSISPETDLDMPADFAVCVLEDPPFEEGAPEDVLPDLALAHNAGEGIEILPPGNSSFLDCSDAAPMAFRTGRWNDFLAALFRPVTPASLLADPGGLGGQASSFSPFGAVDTESGGPVETSTTLEAEPDTVVVGETITLTATVTPAPFTTEAPLVEFFEGENSLGTAPTNVDGVATLVVATSYECFPVACLGWGTHTLIAEFLGTDSHLSSTSAPVTVVVYSD